jgi:hypothetical protein
MSTLIDVPMPRNSRSTSATARFYHSPIAPKSRTSPGRGTSALQRTLP